MKTNDLNNLDEHNVMQQLVKDMSEHLDVSSRSVHPFLTGWDSSSIFALLLYCRRDFVVEVLEKHKTAKPQSKVRDNEEINSVDNIASADLPDSDNST